MPRLSCSVSRPDPLTMPATNAAVAGDIQVTFDQLLAMNMVESGLLRALGMTGLQRSSFAPNVPPIAETLPGYEGSASFNHAFRRWTGSSPSLVRSEKLLAAPV